MLWIAFMFCCRPFGGVNVVFAGDLWQLPPVNAKAIFDNPCRRPKRDSERKAPSAAEQKIFKMFWHKDEDSIQQTFVLKESMRTADLWLQAVLDADRYGNES